MDLILDEGYGQADCQVIRSPDLTPGLAIVDGSYALECVAPPALGLARFLPAQVQSWQIGLDKADWTERFETINMETARIKYDRKQLRQVARRNRTALEELINRTAQLADESLPALIDEARAAVIAEHDEAHSRLAALAKVNPSVDTAELTALDTLRDQRLAALETSHARPVYFPSEALAELGYHSVFCGQKTHYGVALLSRKPAENVSMGFPGDSEEAQKRLISGTITAADGTDCHGGLQHRPAGC